MATDTIHATGFTGAFVHPKYRALIADEQPSFREAIARVLEKDESIEIVGECATGNEALAAIAQHAPDMLFVDVQLPEISGFQVVEASGATIPAVVFVSVLDRYAARAFDAQAADYLVKPFHHARLQQALERAKLRVQMERGRIASSPAHRDSSIEPTMGVPKYLERLALRRGNRVFFQTTQVVDCITSDANYVQVQWGSESHRMRSTMGELERKLNPKQFVRIHRCTIINIECLREFRPLPHGDYLVQLTNGKELTMSRNYRRHFREALAKFSLTQ
jgi:two-component system LytT family response regulator